MAALTIGDNDGQATYSVGGTPSTGPFAVDFVYFSAGEVIVKKIVSGVETTLVNGVDYTLSGVAADDGYSSGSVTLLAAVSDCEIDITREISTEKSVNLSATGPLQISVINTYFSRLFSWVQDMRRRLTSIEGDISGAAASAAAAVAAYDSFDDRYLGAKASDPTVDNDGNALVTGAIYYNTTTGMKVWSGSAWATIASGISEASADLRYLRLAGGTLTGALTLPGSDPTLSNHATRKSYVDTAISTAVAGVASGFTTGDVKLTWKTVADSGWIMHTDGTIGSATSGATYANAAAQALFLLIWDNFADAQAPVVSGRGASAAADWAANKRITLPKALGRSIGVAGAGSGLTSRTLGVTTGAETVTAEMPAHTHSGTRILSSGTAQVWSGVPSEDVAVLSSSDTSGTTGSASSGDGTMSVMQPTAFWNVMIKL